MAKLSTEVIKKALSKKFNCQDKEIKRISKKKNENKQIERVFQINQQSVMVTSDENDQNIISIEDQSISESTSKSTKQTETQKNPSISSVVLNEHQQKVVTAYIETRLKSSFQLNPNQATHVKNVLDERGNIDSIFHVPKSRVGEIYLTASVSPQGELVGYGQLSPREYKKEYVNPPNKKSKPKFSNYYFAISTSKEESDDYYLVSIISKKFWKKNHHSDDQPSPLIDDLPDFISDLNESSEMAAYVDNWNDAYSELINLGFEYSNEVAEYLEEYYPGMHIQP